MKRTEVHNKIDNLIQRLQSSHEDVKMNSVEPSLLEVDLLRKLCIDLYEEISHLRRIPNLEVSRRPFELEEVKPEEKKEIESSPESKDNVEIPDLDEVLIPQIENTSTTPVQDITTPENDNFEEIEKPLINVIPQQEIDAVEIEEGIEKENEEEQKVMVEPESEMIAENNPTERVKESLVEKVSKDYESLKFIPIVEKQVPVFSTPIKPLSDEKSVLEKVSELHKEKNTIHQSISLQKDEKELLEKFLSAKIAKITNAIDISKRFELQNNLFGGDSHSYSRAILALEEAENREKALSVYSELSSKYKWDKENELVQELKSFIYRKY